MTPEESSVLKKKYRVGVIGFAHMHINELIEKFDAHPQTQWVACADTVPVRSSRINVPGSRNANLKRALEEVGIPRAYQDYKEMLDTEQLDIVLCCPENSLHADVVEASANCGVNIVMEKPLAGSLPDAMRILRAVQRNDVKILVDWPTTWLPCVMKVKDLIDNEEIGEVWEFKWRNGASLGPLAPGSVHPGHTVVTGEIDENEAGAEWWYNSQAGGGALLDYCCYGAALSYWYLGQIPTGVQAIRTNLKSQFGSADDNAVIMVQYPNALGIIEGTWTTFHSGIPTGPIIYGTEGTIVVDETVVKVYKKQGELEPTLVLEGDSFPEGSRTVAEVFFNHIENSALLHPTLDIDVNMTTVAILDAAIRSSRTMRMALIDKIGWTIPETF